MRWDARLILGIYAIALGFLVMANSESTAVGDGSPYSGFHVFLMLLSIGIWVVGVPSATLLGINGLVKLSRVGGHKHLSVSIYLAGVLLGPVMMLVPH